MTGNPNLFFGLILLVMLAAVAVIDARWMIIPNLLNGIFALSGLLYSVMAVGRQPLPVMLEMLATLIVLATIAAAYRRLRGRSGFGMGDIKFLGAATAWIGIVSMPWLVLFSSLSGLAYALLKAVLGQGARHDSRIPFGPHLALGTMAAWLLGDQIDPGHWGL